MGRPRKKRKYTKRKLRATNGVDEISSPLHAAELVKKMRRQIMDAPREVAEIVIIDLMLELNWMKQFYDKQETAPAP